MIKQGNATEHVNPILQYCIVLTKLKVFRRTKMLKERNKAQETKYSGTNQYTAEQTNTQRNEPIYTAEQTNIHQNKSIYDGTSKHTRNKPIHSGTNKYTVERNKFSRTNQYTAERTNIQRNKPIYIRTNQ